MEARAGSVCFLLHGLRRRVPDIWHCFLAAARSHRTGDNGLHPCARCICHAFLHHYSVVLFHFKNSAVSVKRAAERTWLSTDSQLLWCSCMLLYDSKMRQDPGSAAADVLVGRFQPYPSISGHHPRRSHLFMRSPVPLAQLRPMPGFRIHQLPLPWSRATPLPWRPIKTLGPGREQ